MYRQDGLRLLDAGDLIALRPFAPLVEEPVVSRNDEVDLYPVGDGGAAPPPHPGNDG